MNKPPVVYSLHYKLIQDLVNSFTSDSNTKTSNNMFCGTGSFSHVDAGDDHPLAPSTPKGSRKKHNKNPYSTRGLDKFSTVLAELEDMREKIMAQAGSQGVAMVRFMYTNSQDWIPIVVRPKPEEPKAAAAAAPAKQQPPSSPRQETKEAAREESTENKKKKKEMKKSLSWNVRERCRRFSYYWALAVVLILVCLVLFGRVFAICCTSIWWYLVPMMVDGNGRRRKELGRRMSDKRLVVSASSQPRKIIGGGLQELASPRAQTHGHRG